MSKLEERKASIEQLVALADDSLAVGAVLVRGDDNTESGDLRVDVLPYEASENTATFTRINYIISSEMDITASQNVSKSETAVIKKYSLANGVEVTMRVAPLEVVQNDGGWYRIVFDDMGAADTLSQSVPEDILCDLAVAEEPAPEAVEEPVQDETPAVAAVPVAVPATEKPVDAETQEYLDFVARNMKNAQRAIASGQMIRASEIVSMLRKMAIELICVSNGIEENYDQAIDFIECEEKYMLAKTYPRNMEQNGVAAALAALSELFDRLI